MPSNSKDDFNIKIRYRVIRRPVKYARLELRGRELWIIIPEDADPMKVIRENRNWVKKQTWIVKQAERLASTLEIVPRTRKKFRALVKRLIEEYSGKLGVEVNKVYIRKMKNAWASCSSEGNISVSREARFLPEELIRYIVYHEVCHLIRWRHDKVFKELIAREFPNYEKLDLQLHAYWIKINAENSSQNKNA